MIRNTGWCIAAAAALLLGGGCGSTGAAGGDDETADTKPGKAATAQQDVKVARASFCDKLDAAAIAGALGEQKLKLLDDLEPGEKYEPAPGFPAVSSNWACVYGKPVKKISEQVNFTALIKGEQMDQAGFDQQLDKILRGRKSVGAQCTKTNAASFGPAGVFLTCTAKHSQSQSTNASGTTTYSSHSGQATAGYYGLLDHSMVWCEAWAADDTALDTMQQGAKAVCPDVLDAMTQS